MKDVMALAEAKAHLSELVRRVHTYHERITVTVHGQPSAVLVSPADLEGLEETIAVLSDTATMMHLATAEAEVQSGKGESEAQLRQAMKQRFDGEQAR